MSVYKKVVVLKKDRLPEGQYRQLYFCEGEDHDRNGRPRWDGVLKLVSLADGSRCEARRGDLLGALKPELLPDEERLQLSMIRPPGALDLRSHGAEFSGYAFLPDGRYREGVWLCNAKEALEYASMQMPYQHRVMLCDRDDFTVMEIRQGRVVFPQMSESMEAVLKENFPEFLRAMYMPEGGMEMK